MRRFFELAAAGPAPIASEALERIAKLYAVESEIRGRSADERRDLRQEKSRPVIDDLESWLRAASVAGGAGLVNGAAEEDRRRFLRQFRQGCEWRLTAEQIPRCALKGSTRERSQRSRRQDKKWLSLLADYPLTAIAVAECWKIPPGREGRSFRTAVTNW